MFIILLGIITLISILYVFFIYSIKVTVGRPPFKEIILAYKYLYFGKYSKKCLYDLKTIFPQHSVVKLCYSGPKSTKLEFALGVILDAETWKHDKPLLQKLINTGLTFFKTPEITNALYSEYTIIPWLPFTKWLAIAIAYKKHFNYAEEYNLCAYPALEIYSKYKVTIILPLVQQDDFVVTEAERIVYGRTCSAMLQPLSKAPSQLTKPLSQVNTTSNKRKGIKMLKSLRETKG